MSDTANFFRLCPSVSFFFTSEPRGVHEISPRGLSPPGPAGGLRGRHWRRAERHELEDDDDDDVKGELT